MQRLVAALRVDAALAQADAPRETVHDPRIDPSGAGFAKGLASLRRVGSAAVTSILIDFFLHHKSIDDQS